MWPAFLKTNVAVPGFAIDFVESLKKNSPPLTWTVVAVAAAFCALRAEASWTSVSAAIATAASARVERMVSCFISKYLLRDRVGDQLEFRVLEEAGRGGADEQCVAVDRGEGIDPGGRLRGPERLPGLGVERVD